MGHRHAYQQQISDLARRRIDAELAGVHEQDAVDFDPTEGGKWLPLQKACSMLGVSRQTFHGKAGELLRSVIANKDLGAFGLGRKRLYLRADVERLAELKRKFGYTLNDAARTFCDEQPA